MSLAFVFPGQGAQAVGMGRALAEAYPEARETFETVDAALGEPLSRLCFDGPEADLVRTANTQPAVLAVDIAALRAVRARTGLRPTFVAGHSLGEYAARSAAGDTV
jgi:[acyl-carrier-protein] S-malonyltransferase